MGPLNVLRVAAVALNTIFFGGLVFLISAFEQDGKLGWRLARGWVWLNMKITRCRVVTHGLENVDPSCQYVFMANHRSKADIVAIAWALKDFQLRWVAKKELAAVPFFGWGLRAMKNIIVDRSNREQAIQSYAVARERIRRGISVLVFPEGTRGEGDKLWPFKKGGFVFAMETETPIVPVAVRGATKVSPRKTWELRPGTIEVVLGRPIEVAGRSPYNKQPLMEEVRAELQALVLHGADAGAARRDVAGAS